MSSSADRALERHRTLVNNLQRPRCYTHPFRDFQRIETHISTILLVGDYAYKIKKPLNLGFLDFTHKKDRHHFCEEEIRVNKRFAPELYLETTKVTGTLEDPRWSNHGDALEYAVKMRRFDQSALLSHRLDQCTGEHFEALAKDIAKVHAEAEQASVESALGSPITIVDPANANFSQVLARVRESSLRDSLAQLQMWNDRAGHRLEATFAERQAQGFVREGHGDLHLDNLVWHNNRITPFDAIEFDPALRFIDQINEIAFLTMDLDKAGYRHLGSRFLNAYLEATGDYEGMVLHRFYAVYRAMVRAKIHAIQREQSDQGSPEWQRHTAEIQSYITLAFKYTRPQRPFMVLTHGFSGTGKSTLSRYLCESCGAIRIRSDVERKRLAGKHPDIGLYSAEMNALTYEHLARMAVVLLGAGRSVVVDATFLKKAQREQFYEVAQAMGCELRIMSLTGDIDQLRRRLVARAGLGDDPSDATPAVLDAQRGNEDPLNEWEEQRTWHITAMDAVKAERQLAQHIHDMVHGKVKQEVEAERV